MIGHLFCLALLSFACSARELQQVAPAPSPSTSYTVPNWMDEVKIANATLPVGGTLSISWKGRHGVYQVTSYACPDSFPTPNPNGLEAEAASGGKFETTFNKTGTYYFACQVGDHCSEGQLIAVKVE